MKSITPELKAHLETGGPFLMADLYTITLVSGVTLRWVDYDIDVTANGWSFSSNGPAVKRGKTRVVIGVEVDTLDISIYPKPSDMVDGMPITAAGPAGTFDGASIKLERAFMTAPNTVVGTVVLFVGRCADLTCGRTELQLRVNSSVEALNCNLPRNLYQAPCLHSLYDTDCGVARASFGISSIVTSGSTSILLNSGLSNQDGWFDRGYIVMLNGALAGARRTIKKYSDSSILLLSPLPATPSVGDAFIAYPGCNKSSDCAEKFFNLSNFRATPLIPTPETAT